MMLSAAQVEGLKKVACTSCEYVIGIDEVGLGSIAGPLTVAGAVFHRDWWHPEVKDSKQFNSSKSRSAHEKRAAVLRDAILPNVKFYTVLAVAAPEIDSIGIEQALDDLNRAVYMQCVGEYPDSLVVMDGTIAYSSHKAVLKQAIAFPKADGLVPAVGAASILAKVTRDEYMLQIDATYPGYGFSVHKGYGTPKHQQAIQNLGLCAEHRRSYKTIASFTSGLKYPDGKRRRP